MENNWVRRASPANFAFPMPKASAWELHQQQNASLQESPPERAGRVSPEYSIAGGLAPTASGAHSVASALGSPTRSDPGRAVRTYHEGCEPTLKTGTFYLAGNRNFLFGSDTAILPEKSAPENRQFLAALLERAGVKADRVGKLQRRKRNLGSKSAWFFLNCTHETVQESVPLEDFRSAAPLLGGDLEIREGKVRISVEPMDICCLILEKT